MTAQSDVRSPSKQRRTTLRVFYVFVFASIAAFTLGVRASHSQKALTMLGILLAGGGIWSFDSSEPQTHIRNSSTTKRQALPLLRPCFLRSLSVSSSDSGCFPVPLSWSRL